MQQNAILYDILEENAGQFLLRMKEGHPVYQGHFPENPITPGVLTLQMVRECLSRNVGRELQFSSIKNCRFAAMIKPGDILRLAFLTDTNEETVHVKANLVGADDSDNLRLSLDAELR